ncbi:MAG: DUF5689 domain-containing protein [Bacteroidales bacterium]|nr:DUF5689 domain-containing protein [Bacteroidales bacterium]
MKKINLYLLVFAALVSVLSSCKKWEAPELQEPQYTGKKANKTIADIKALHQLDNAPDSIKPLSGNYFIVDAVVVSSDEGGNCYKYITIQDETGGIEISIDQSSLFNEYPVGQVVYLNCDGLVVGDYSGKYQVGWIYNNSSIGRINYMMLSKYLSKDGFPSVDNIKKYSIDGEGIHVIKSNANLAESWGNCLCKIVGARFKSECHGKQLATNDLTCDRDLDNFSITVRTSNYAKFRNIVIDANESYDLTGILSIYKGKYQFTLRTADDMQIHQDPASTVMRFDENSMTSGGWFVAQGDESSWAYSANSDALRHNNSPIGAAVCDDWLVSPVINPEHSTMVLTHKISAEGDPDPLHYQMYISTVYEGGAINPEDWTLVSIGNYPNEFGESSEIAIPSGPFRVAFRYVKTNAITSTAMWNLKSLKFYTER